MNFDLVTVAYTLNEETNELAETTQTIPHRAAFESGTIKVWRIEDEKEFYVVEQPWKNNSDGSRSAWAGIEEGVAWFKASNGHLGE